MNGRVFQYRRVWTLDQPTLQAACRLLAAAAPDLPPRVDLVIGVARGGVRPAELVAGHLGVDVTTLAARHNDGDDAYLQATGRVKVGPFDQAAVAGRNVLLVDDITGSGATVLAVGARLRDAGARQVRTATLCRNSGAPAPDLWVWTVDDWVVFPWEPDTFPAPGPEHTPLPFPEKVNWR